MKSLQEYKDKKKKEKIVILSLQILLFISFFLIWELLSRFNIINSFLFSSPSKVISLFYSYLVDQSIFPHIKTSTIEALLSLIISSFSGIIIATILYMSKYVKRIIDPYLTILNAIPKSALGIIFIIWFGTSLKGIIAVSISFSIIITIISTLNYFNNVDEDLIKMMKILGANKIQILFKIVYPSNLNNLLSIIKVNVGLSWVGVIVGEFIASRNGIGYLILYGGQVFKMDLVMMGIIFLSLIALLMYETINLLQLIIIKRLNYEN
ncbi:MAG: ABC transporter permease [Bacillales bacterium]|nr:ABC transporter permease [Bacillales bacterium]